MNKIQKTDPETLKIRADDARSILRNPGFIAATDRMEKTIIEQLKGVPVGDLTVPALHARLRALEDLKAELQSALTDYNMSLRRGEE